MGAEGGAAAGGGAAGGGADDGISGSAMVVLLVEVANTSNAPRRGKIWPRSKPCRSLPAAPGPVHAEGARAHVAGQVARQRRELLLDALDRVLEPALDRAARPLAG